MWPFTPTRTQLRLTDIETTLHRIEHKLDRALRGIARLTTSQGETMADLSQLQAAVAADSTVTASVKTLLGQLADKVDDLKGSVEDPAAQAEIDALVAEIRSNTDGLAEAAADSDDVLVDGDPAPEEPAPEEPAPDNGTPGNPDEQTPDVPPGDVENPAPGEPGGPDVGTPAEDPGPVSVPGDEPVIDGNEVTNPPQEGSPEAEGGEV